MKNIVQDGDPVLREIAEEVPDSLFNTKELNEILERMKVALDGEADGVALAAPQIGISMRIFIVRYDRLTTHPNSEVLPPSVGVYINPDFTRTSRKRALLEEGCLSVRGMYGHTHRFEQASVRAQDEKSTVFERGAGGLLAQIFQHEVDHLNGILFSDHSIDLYEYQKLIDERKNKKRKADVESGDTEDSRYAAPPSTSGSPRFAYFGTPYVARDTLEELVRNGFTPSVIITSPDAQRGRGLAMAPCETKVWAEERTLPVFSPEKLDDAAIEKIASYGCLYGIAVAYGKIIPQALIDLFPLGILNVHYSLLPAYRGASPVEAALLHGETETGVTIQQMAFKLDTGAVLTQEKIAIDPLDTTVELKPKLIALGASLLTETLPRFYKGEVNPVPQDENKATHAPKIKKEEGLLTLSDTSTGFESWNKFRAYKESPATYFYMTKGDERLRVKIRDASFEGGIFMPTRIVPEGKKEQPFSYIEQNGWSVE